MKPSTIILIIVLVLISVGVTYYVLTKDDDSSNTALSNTLTVSNTFTMSNTFSSSSTTDDDDEPPEPTHPLSGDHFLVTSGSKIGVIKPKIKAEEGNFELDTTGARSDDMVITLEPVDDVSNTYYFKAKQIGKYMRHKTNGFQLSSNNEAEEYKIKLTKISGKYVMSYNTADGWVYFGFDGVDKFVTNPNVTGIINSGSITLEEAGVDSFILKGHFGSVTTGFTAFGAPDGEDPITNIKGCLDILPDVDMSDEYRDSIISVAYSPNADGDNQCRAYPRSDTYLYNENVGGGWITKCVEPGKDIKQGCIL